MRGKSSGQGVYKIVVGPRGSGVEEATMTEELPSAKLPEKAPLPSVEEFQYQIPRDSQQSPTSTGSEEREGGKYNKGGESQNNVN